MIREIKTYKDLPEYGEFVLVWGVDKSMYGIKAWHVCEMNDHEDGLDFRDSGRFMWLTENGTRIEDVTHWSNLPTVFEVGDIVCPKPNGRYLLVSGMTWYEDAVVVSSKPFILVSREGDMRWQTTVRKNGFEIVGKADAETLKTCMKRLKG